MGTNAAERFLSSAAGTAILHRGTFHRTCGQRERIVAGRPLERAGFRDGAERALDVSNRKDDFVATQLLPERKTLPPRSIPPSLPPSDPEEASFEEDSPWARWVDVPSWAVSLALHVLILLLLASITTISVATPDPQISSLLEEKVDPEAYKLQSIVIDQIGSDSPMNTLAPSQDAAQHVKRDPQEKLQEQLKEEILTVNVPVTNAVPQPHESELLEQVDTTGATEHPGGVEGAMDRLTFEIANSLRERKTFVIWLVDASLSLRERHAAIADRFENVYQQLGQLNLTRDKALKTAVVRFGEQVEFLTTDPVDDIREVAPLIRNIAPDTSGKENTFSAVAMAARQWPEYTRPGTATRRNVMMIIVTDERGDDYHLLEDVIQYVRRYGIKVYCVGNAAVFGQEKGYVSFTDDTGYSWHDLPVDQGPETVAPERLQLPFWGGPGARELDRMSATFGPYALTRLCTESGGLYLITEEGRGPRFDPHIMRNYIPDYRPIRAYEEELSKNLAKGALVRAAVATKADPPPTPQLAFRADSDTVLRQEITEAQKPFAVFDYKLQEMANLLLAGEKDRPRLDSPRWKASYDLALGRVLAMRVRAFGYNLVLADMKSTPKSFSTPGNNQWKLVPSQEINGGPEVRKLAKKALEYLTRVVDEHPGTPWAMLAERELGQPLGWAWEESRINIPQAGGNGNDRKTIQLADDEQKKKSMPKPAPPPPRTPPKL